MMLDQLPAWAFEMLRSARVGRLGFVDDRDRPRVQPVTFALAHGALYSAVDSKPKRAGEPARVRYLRRTPRAALTVDHYSDDWDELAWVQLLGQVQLLAPGDEPAAMDALAAKYAQYRSEAPQGPLLELVPQRALHWRASEHH